MISNDPRYVALTVEHLEPVNREDLKLWIRGLVPLEAGEKVQVVFATSQCRLYPLTEERFTTEERSRKPPAFRVGLDASCSSKDHLIMSQHGISVFVPMAAREKRIEWQLERLRTGNVGDYVGAVMDIEQLLAHRLAFRDIPLNADTRGRYRIFNDMKLEALGFDMPDAQKIGILAGAIRIGRKLAGMD